MQIPVSIQTAGLGGPCSWQHPIRALSLRHPTLGVEYRSLSGQDLDLELCDPMTVAQACLAGGRTLRSASLIRPSHT